MNEQKLHETELDAVAGGGATQNRYDPQRCSNTKQVAYECVGFLANTWCDHYRERKISGTHYTNDVYRYTCVMGCYDYNGDHYGKPV